MICQEYRLPDTAQLNSRLFERFEQLARRGRFRETHHVGGRFENLYIDSNEIPDISTVLNCFRQQAAGRLGRDMQQLKVGFWFNAMAPGQRTLLHHHDEDDELLSAVYYVRVPAQSGELILYENDRPVRVTPEAGKLVLFAPHVPHEVTVNNSRELRLSVAMNIGPIEA